MWDIKYEFKNDQLIVILTLVDGFVVDDGITEYGTSFNILKYTATPGQTPTQPIIKPTGFHKLNGTKPLEIQLFEEEVKQVFKKTKENVTDKKYAK